MSGLRRWWVRRVHHPWLTGDREMSGREVGQRARLLTIAAIVVANTVGAVVVVLFALLVLPKPPGVMDATSVATNLALAGAYLLGALVIGVRWGRGRIERGPDGLREWLFAERSPTARERATVLRAPVRIMLIQAALWGAATACFVALNAPRSWLLALGVGLTVLLGGITTSAAAYLLGELALRPVVARALAGHPPERAGPGLAVRWLLAWALGTGVPIVGLILVGIVALTPVPISKDSYVVTSIVLASIGLVFGALVSVLAAFATDEPIRRLRDALGRVARGDLDADVAVTDATEIGLLQAGFNDMAAGLRERERLRDVFGRQVGHDVAGLALTDGIELGGEERDVAVLFVDLVGSTALAAERDPQEVVATLNRFFAEVVDVVEDAGGWINKFAGDAALAIFGAPIELEDRAGAALRAARTLRDRLRDAVPELDFGVGVGNGLAVAGHIGAERRYEYTVIGDPVNEAARLSELAKADDGRVLASGRALDAAGAEEARRWRRDESTTLRGRKERTELARPAPEAPARSY